MSTRQAVFQSKRSQLLVVPLKLGEASIAHKLEDYFEQPLVSIFGVGRALIAHRPNIVKELCSQDGQLLKYGAGHSFGDAGGGIQDTEETSGRP